MAGFSIENPTWGVFQLLLQVPSLPIEFNGANDHSLLTMLLGNAPLAETSTKAGSHQGQYL